MAVDPVQGVVRDSDAPAVALLASTSPRLSGVIDQPSQTGLPVEKKKTYGTSNRDCRVLSLPKFG